jgi:hypothetical protein
MDALTAGDTGWDLYSSTGLRNVLYEGTRAPAELSGPFPRDPENFRCDIHAWPRPAWHTLRRLAWLLAHADRVEAVYQNAENGAMAVRLVSNRGFPDPLEPADPRTWRYAYVAWRDGSDAAVGVAYWELDLGPFLSLVDTRLQWERLPLVPAVSSISGTAPDDYGFARADSVDWRATPQTSTVKKGGAYSHEYLVVEVRPSDPTENPAPICVLCDLEVQGISSAPPVVSVPEGTIPTSEQAEETVTWSTREGSTAPRDASRKTRVASGRSAAASPSDSPSGSIPDPKGGGSGTSR